MTTDQIMAYAKAAEAQVNGNDWYSEFLNCGI